MLDADQQRAVDSDARRLGVIAGAGTGKTRVLTHRAARVCELAGAHRVLCVTFTRKAAGEMRERLDAMDIVAPEIRTLHAWAATVLRGHAHEIGRTSKFRVYDEVDSLDLLRLCAVEWYPTSGNERRESMLRDDRVRRLYLRRLKEADAVDFDGLEMLALTLAEKGAFRGMYDHVLVDEAQDLSRNQAKILAWMNPDNLCMVGDPRQSIYRFRGAVPSIFQNYLDADTTTRVNLTTNYRSRVRIVDAANTVVTNRWGLMDASRDDDPFDVELHVGHEPRIVLDRVVALDVAGTPLSDIAVLGRTWRELDDVRTALEREGVPHTYYGGASDVWSEPNARRLARVLAMVDQPSDDNMSALSVNWGRTRIEGSQLRLMWSRVTEERRSLLALAAETSPAMDRLRRLVMAPPDEFVDDVGALAAEILTIVLGRVPDNMVELVTSLAGQSLEDWRAWWTGGRLEDDPKNNERGEGVQLMTIHAGKGLEWPVVIGLGCMAGAFPPRTKNIDEREESCRLLYVLVTRACDRLILTRPDLWRNRPTEWSPFLADVLGAE